MLTRNDPEMKEAAPCVKRISFIEQWRWKKFIRQMWKRDGQVAERQFELDLAKARAKGRADGMERGIKIGLAESKLEIARKMKQAGRPFGEIAEVTGLTVEEVISYW
jgi:predicted transposase/invertase (TIGR01784 family)